MIERNLHAAGRRANVLFGVAEVVDGLVRVLSAGFFHTRLTLSLAVGRCGVIFSVGQ